MRVLALILLALVVFTAGVHVGSPNSVPVSNVETPKLAHHVVYFWVCDKLIGVLLTTEPFIWSDAASGLPPDDVISLMVEAELAGRLVAIEHKHRGCSTPTEKT